MERLHLQIQGMSCGHCVSRVREGLSRVSGIEVGPVAVGSAELRYDPTRTSQDQIVQTVEDLGYEVTGSGRAA
ncbi:MAG TPA: cation transporter [Thermoanaerobaculia bacterium]|nr:cation transporter [Thermoanaerobaculia bacterium]